MQEALRDYDIRQALKPYLRERFLATPSLILDELGFNGHAARIDVAVVNCALHAYEIKSDRDTLSRLPAQLSEYRGQFHFVTVVTAPKHLAGVLEICHDDVGIITAERSSTGSVELKEIRVPSKLSQSAERIARLFWWSEAKETLERNGFARGMSRKNATQLREALLKHISYPQLLEELRVVLQARRDEQAAQRSKSSGDLSLIF